ncbi:hypothetical protein Hanom_Chr09g00759791 [Helianthus anomalus]
MISPSSDTLSSLDTLSSSSDTVLSSSVPSVVETTVSFCSDSDSGSGFFASRGLSSSVNMDFQFCPRHISMCSCSKEINTHGTRSCSVKNEITKC